jgi:hypothetical protein
MNTAGVDIFPDQQGQWLNQRPGGRKNLFSVLTRWDRSNAAWGFGSTAPNRACTRGSETHEPQGWTGWSRLSDRTGTKDNTVAALAVALSG